MAENEIDSGVLAMDLFDEIMDEAQKMSGWGKKSVQNVRNWLGIPDDFELALQIGGDKA